MKTKIILGIVIGILGLFIVQGSFQSAPYGGTMDINRFSEATNSVVTNATTSSFTILSVNTGRKYALITNEGTIDLDLTLGSTATAGQGVRLETGESYEINPLNLYVGAVSGITATSGAANIFTIEE